jgi:hypothetical protein
MKSESKSLACHGCHDVHCTCDQVVDSKYSVERNQIMPKSTKRTRKLETVSIQVMDNGYVVYAQFTNNTEQKEVYTNPADVISAISKLIRVEDK